MINSFTICFTGPECSGKSTLSEFVSNEFGATLIKEYARTYLTGIGRPYIKEDLGVIAKTQLNQLIESISDKKITVIDTGAEVVKVWCEVRFNDDDQVIYELVQRQHAIVDLYVLCKPDIPWEADSFRESQFDRDRLYEIYKAFLEKEEVPFIEISGELIQRKADLTEAIKFLA